MLFQRNSLEKVFEKHYRNMLYITRQVPNIINAEFELLPAMFVISGYVKQDNRKDRERAAMALNREVFKLYVGLDEDRFIQRMNLYIAIIKGHQLRCDWMGPLVDVERITSEFDAITRCACLLSDFLYNPACAEDYDNAPTKYMAPSESGAYLDKVIKPLQDEIYSYARAIKNAW